MFECKFSSGQFFKDLIDTISSFLEDGELVAKHDGLELRAIEQSRVAMIDLFVSKNLCQTYTCDKELKLKINFSDLVKMVSRTSSTDEVFLRYMHDTNKLQVKFKGKAIKTFNIPLLEEVNCESMQPTKIANDVQINMKTNILSQAIKDSKIIGDTIDFKVSKNGEVSIVVNSDRGDLTITFEEKPVRNDAGGDVSAKYSLNFLLKILKAAVLSDDVVVQFSTDKPIELKFLIQNDEKFGRVIYYLAPQVEEEEAETPEEEADIEASEEDNVEEESDEFEE